MNASVRSFTGPGVASSAGLVDRVKENLSLALLCSASALAGRNLLDTNPSCAHHTRCARVYLQVPLRQEAGDGRWYGVQRQWTGRQRNLGQWAPGAMPFWLPPHLSPPPGSWGLLPQPEAPADGPVDL